MSRGVDLAAVGRNLYRVEQQFQATAQGTTAIDRGADLLVRVLESDEPVALSDLASASGIPKSTASRLVSALERRGLIEQDGDRGRLRPGPAILRVAERSMLQRHLVELARPSLDALSEACGETINLAVPAGADVLNVAEVASTYILSSSGGWVGRRTRPHAVANGKVLLAFGAIPAPASLERYTEHTVTDPGVLRAELARVRRDGYATAVAELEEGLVAVAAPVLGPGGGCVAALSVSGPVFRMPPDQLGKLGRLCADC